MPQRSVKRAARRAKVEGLTATAQPPRDFAYTSRTTPSERHLDHNEDCRVIDRHRGLAAVFDGVGGSVAGGLAAQVAALVIREGWRELVRQWQPARPTNTLGAADPVAVSAALLTLLGQAHEQVCEAGARLAEAGLALDGDASPATTVALVTFFRQPECDRHTMAYAWIGDSRVYLLRGAEPITRLTQDDGLLTRLVQDQVLTPAQETFIDQATDAGLLTELGLMLFSQRNGITQSLGGPKPPEAHCATMELAPGDVILLSTDGIHDNLTDATLEEALRHTPRPRAAGRLVALALRSSRQDLNDWLRAKPDDMTAVVIAHAGE
ncbi:MAG TPA: PP2C family serine/threonine-protein phosphatase [Ktedonobacterales bacterium]|nr:PP2C family serine/threonine-protein phosphatase [Ktedonobacterales bacterium]